MKEGMRVRVNAVRGLTAPQLLDEPYLFQVPPLDEFSRSYAFSHSDYDTIRKGQFSRPGGRQLATIQFQTLFIDEDHYWTVGERPPDPVQAGRKLQRVCEAGTPFRLRCGMPSLWDDRWEVDMLATLRTVTVAERAGEVDCRYVDVAFTEFREIEVPRRQQGGGDGGGGGGGRSHEGSQTWPVHHKIKPGDTLSSLSKKYYGEHRFWRAIAKANKIGQSADPSESLSRDKVTIPEPPKGAG